MEIKNIKKIKISMDIQSSSNYWNNNILAQDVTDFEQINANNKIIINFLNQFKYRY